MQAGSSGQLTMRERLQLSLGIRRADCHSRPRENFIRFTPVQVEAIRSGVNPGLTMVVGPPGTGKTDTAVQA